MKNKPSAAYLKGYAGAQKEFYWGWQKERDRARFKTEAKRKEFDEGFDEGLVDKYKLKESN